MITLGMPYPNDDNFLGYAFVALFILLNSDHIAPRNEACRDKADVIENSVGVDNQAGIAVGELFQGSEQKVAEKKQGKDRKAPLICRIGRESPYKVEYECQTGTYCHWPGRYRDDQEFAFADR